MLKDLKHFTILHSPTCTAMEQIANFIMYTKIKITFFVQPNTILSSYKELHFTNRNLKSTDLKQKLESVKDIDFAIFKSSRWNKWSSKKILKQHSKFTNHTM